MLHWLGLNNLGHMQKRPTYDDIIQGISGMAAMQEEEGDSLRECVSM